MNDSQTHFAVCAHVCFLFPNSDNLQFLLGGKSELLINDNDDDNDDDDDDHDDDDDDDDDDGNDNSLLE